jgi:hypothetical protein
MPIIDVSRYAHFDPNEQRDDDGKWMAAVAKAGRADPKLVEKYPYMSMTSFPLYADTPDRSDWRPRHRRRCTNGRRPSPRG